MSEETFSGSPQLIRMLSLVKLLSAEPLPAKTIIDRLGEYYAPGPSGERRLRQDIRQLRDWGFSIVARRDPYRYQLTYTPLAVPLSNEHIDALATLRDSLGRSHLLGEPLVRLLELLAIGMDHEQRDRLQRPAAIQLTLTTAVNYNACRPLIQPIQRAIINDKQISFDYYSLEQRDRPLRHVVDPYAIEYYQQHIYVVGYSHLTRQITDFRLDQIVPGSFRSLPTASDHTRELYPYQFRYRLAAKLVRRGISTRFTDQQVIQTFADGSVEIAARARSQFYALRGLLRYAENARATFPPELVAELRATLDAMRAQYED